MASFIVIPVGKLVSGGKHGHADVPEQFLVMVGPGAAHKHHGGFALAPGFDLLDFGVNRRHFLGYYRFHPVDEFLVFKIRGDFAQAARG